MFHFGSGNDQTTAVQRETVEKTVPKAFPQAGHRMSTPQMHAMMAKRKKKPMRFGNPPKSDGLDMDAILGKTED